MTVTREQRLRRDGDQDPVLFYSSRAKWGEFSNFSDHAIVMLSPWTLRPTTYRRGEHRFQALKATRQEDHDRIVQAGGPGEAKDIGRSIRLRDDWGNSYGDACWWAMVDLVMAKATQHDCVREALRRTIGHVIYEDSPRDGIWGWYNGDPRTTQGSYDGKNLLGLAWMHARCSFFQRAVTR